MSEEEKKDEEQKSGEAGPGSAEEEAPAAPEADAKEAPKEETPAELAEGHPEEDEGPQASGTNNEASAEEEAPADPDAKAEDLPEPASAEEAKEPEVLPDDEDLSEVKGEEVDKATLNRHIKPGMIVRVHETIKDVTPSGEERKRTQVFEGTVLGLKGSGIGRTMTIRKVSKGFGVEKIYPLASPNIEKVEVLKQLKVRRAKLNFLRGVIKRGRVKKRFKRKLKETDISK